MSSRLPLARALLIAGLVALGLTACGRRGALEAPPDPSTPQAQAQTQTDDDDEAEGTVPSPVGTPRQKGAKRGYVIPKEPFVLDPLL
jgi:predicted small lipoprotein YifL